MLVDPNIIKGLAKKSVLFLSSVVVLSITVKTQTSTDSSYKVVKKALGSYDSSKRYLKSLVKGTGIYLYGAVANIIITFTGQLLINDISSRHQFIANCFRITFPTFNFFSSLFFVKQHQQKEHEEVENHESISMFSLIKNRPKSTITCLSYYIGVCYLRSKFCNMILLKIQNYLMDQNNYNMFINSQLSTFKYQTYRIFYLIFTNIFYSAVFGSFLIIPFENIANQYCKQLVSIVKSTPTPITISNNNDQFNFIKLNPISIAIETIKEKGLVSSFYSGFPSVYVSSFIQ